MIRLQKLLSLDIFCVRNFWSNSVFIVSMMYSAGIIPGIVHALI